jgi:Sulfotransferase family
VLPQTFSYQDLHANIAELLAKDLFFIGAHPKSGTTWLQTMLNAHPEVSCSGEGHFLNRFAPLLENALKTHNQLIARKNGSIFKEFKPFPRFDNAEFSYLLASAIALMLLRSNDHRQARTIGEKTPDNVMHFTRLAALYPQAKFLHVVRDGRDCAVSTWFHNLRVNPGETQRRYKDVADLALAIAKIWKNHVEHGMRFCTANPGRCLVIRYENLVSQPRKTMRAVFRFLGVDASLDILHCCVDEGRFEKMSGGRPPGIEDRTSFLRQGMPGNWRQHFNAETNRAFLEIAGDPMRQLGYS